MGILHCVKCLTFFQPGEKCVEILESVIEDTGIEEPNLTVHSTETMALLCKKCEDEVFPALWADVNEPTKEGKDDTARQIKYIGNRK